MIQVNPEAARALAARLSKIDIATDNVLPSMAETGDRRLLINFWFYLVAICQHTASFQGNIDGRWLRGWDYLEAAGRRHIGRFTAEQVASFTSQDLQSILSDNGDPALSALDRVEERLGQLHECARLLLSDYAGDVNELYHRAGGWLAGPAGMLDALSRFGPYGDPVRKKSFLFLEMAGASGIWDLKDPESLRVPVDYHIMRVALRSGLVRVTDPALDRTLKERLPVSEETDRLIRTRVEEACDLLVKWSGKSVFQMDMLLWHIGRSCCFYEHGPCCSGCTRPATCTLAEALGGCPDRCPLDGACAGSRDPAYREYWEPNIYTTYY